MVNKITSQEYADLIVDNQSSYSIENPEKISPINERFSILHLPIEDLNKCSIGTFPYALFPKCYTLESIASLEASGVTRIQNNPNFGLLGQGVLIGIIDTGIDYQHQAFLNNDNTTKIVSIWDQTIDSGNEPSGNIAYGTEYSSEIINLALSTDNPLEIVPSQDDIGHGTALTGIIAGNESLANNFRGVVPNAELVIVKLKQAKKASRDIFAIPSDAICYQETDIMLAANYLYTISRQLDQPMVICIALGTSQGNHNGRDTLDEYLSFINDNRDIGVLISCGNEGNAKRHYFGLTNSLINYNEFELNVGENEFGFSMEIWQAPPYRLSIDITSPTGEFISPILPSINKCRKITFIFETTIVYINNVISESRTGEQLILIRFENPTRGIWRFGARNIDRQNAPFNVYLPSGDLISENTYLLKSNPNNTMTSPGSAHSPITITAYNNVIGSILLDSSRGYTRREMIKPDLAAPGVYLTCPLINNQYGTATGTGAATAHAAGIVAMLLEWGVVKGNYPNLYGTEIKKFLIRGAKREGTLIYPNNIWGYGIIDIVGTFTKLS